MTVPKTRISILGLSHDHIWGELFHLRQNLDLAEIVSVYDPHPELQQRFREEMNGQGTIVPDPEDILGDESIHAVFVFGDNRASAAWTAEAARREKAVMVEKPLAADLAGASALQEVISSDSSPLIMVNWPFAWWPSLQEALRLAKEGAIGELWSVHYRAAHAGPDVIGCSQPFVEWLFDPARNGGGAL
ncbi:MAG: Gfo/Idh/MocA family oxidoreductase, partial [Verrucomicrobiota bacterium]